MDDQPVHISSSSQVDRKLPLRVGALLTGLSLLLAACSSTDQAGEQKSNQDFFGYAISDPLVTTNAGSMVGYSTNATKFAGRLYPGAYVQGPRGQLIPNTDLVETQPLPGAQKKVVYRINQNATFSDGAPVTCESFLLAFVAGQQSTYFDSHMPLMDQVEKVECQPNSRQATVVFNEDMGERWRYLFPGGTLLPAHAVAAKAGMTLEELNLGLLSLDSEMLQRVADVWNTGFDLAAFDPALQVSSGPYVVDHVGPQGEVVLRTNEAYHGAKPAQERLVVWPEGTNIADLSVNGQLQVAEVTNPVETTGWVNTDDPQNQYEVSAESGVLSEHLILGSAGTFYRESSRRAFAACVDQTAVAAASSEASGVQVNPTTVRVVRHSDAVASRLADISDPYLAVDTTKAQALSGTTIRIGYAGPDPRKAAMVAAIKASCELAGIVVEDASAEAPTLRELNRTMESEFGYETYKTDGVDAFLGTVDAQLAFPEVATESTNLEAIRDAERESWETIPTIPLAVEPRVFVTNKSVQNLVPNTDIYGIGWNMDRWLADLSAKPTTS